MKQRITIFLFILVLPFGLMALDHTHKEFDVLLKKYVNPRGRVNYNGFKRDKKKLETYLSSLSAVSRSEYNKFSYKQKLAFLINAYNGYTIKLILDDQSKNKKWTKSIKKIGGWFGSPWKIEFFKLLGKKRNLDWIEHQKLRKFGEPRIHAAIVCASIGCPILLNQAFTPGKIYKQLQTQMVKFLKDKEKNRYDTKKNVLYLSPIFKWFKEDFTKGTKKDKDLIAYLKKVMKGTGSSIEKAPLNASIEYTDYDWNLNEQ